MKKHPGLFVVFAFAVITLCLATGCKKAVPPVTCYNPIPDTAYVGQSVTFSSCTTGASSYYWNFGDGGFATTATATHIYTQPGIDTGIFYTADGPGSHKDFVIVVIRPINLWTFKGSTDTSLYAIAANDTLEATNFSSTNMTNVSNITLIFSTLPTANGDYLVVNDLLTPPAAGQVAIYLTTPGSNNYGSTGRDNASANVIISGGKVLFSLPRAMMVNTTNPADSSILTATIRQTE